jgi:hypothetical protein
MSLNFKIAEVNADNIADHTGVICFINPKNNCYKLKIEWLKEQFLNGLKIKLLYLPGEKSPKGFIEYVPGEFCWRAVEAKGYMFIHCIWTSGKKFQHHGLGNALINEAEKDSASMNGMVVMTSDGPLMANKSIFLKNGYSIVDESGKDRLLYKPFREAHLPAFKTQNIVFDDYKGLSLIYSKQCPWVARFIEDVKPILTNRKIDFKITELRTFKEAQGAPSPYGVFNLIWNGKVLADRYISTTRFENIIRKEIKT